MSGEKKSQLLTLLIIMACLEFCELKEARTFGTVPEIIYEPTEFYSHNRTTLYEITLIYTNPCVVLETGHSFEDNSELKINSTMRKTLHKLCDQSYKEVWLPGIREIINFAPKKEGNIEGSYLGRQKRGLALGILAAWEGVAAVGGGIAHAIHFFRVNNIKDRLDEIDNFSKISAAKQKAFLDEAVQALKQKTEKITSVNLALIEGSVMTPEYMWTTVKLHSLIVNSRRDYEHLLNGLKKTGQIDLEALQRQTNLSALKQLAQERTSLDSITANADQALTIKFRYEEENKDVSVVRLLPFNVWVTVDGEEKYLKYSGPEYLLWNKTSNCRRTIKKPKSMSVFVTCTTRNYYDRELDNWTAIDKPSVEESVQIIGTPRDLLIYCKHNKITIDGDVSDCQDRVMKISKSHSITLIDNHYEPVGFSKLDTKSNDWSFNHKYLNKSQVKEAYGDNLDLKLYLAQADLEGYLSAGELFINVTRTGLLAWLVIVGFVLILGLLVFVACRINAKKRNRQSETTTNNNTNIKLMRAPKSSKSPRSKDKH